MTTSRTRKPLVKPASDNAAPSTLSQVATVVRRLGATSVLAVIAGTLPVIGGFVLLWRVQSVAPWLRDHGELGVLFYVAGFSLFAGLALLPTYAQSVVGGWAFGLAIGLPAALAGFSGAATLAYLIARRVSGDRVLVLIAEKPKWATVYQALLGGGFWRTLGLVILLRLPPNSPFSMTNLVMAATRVPLIPYVLGTALGMAPRTAAVVYLGSTLERLDFSGQKWMVVASIVSTGIVLAILGHIANHALARATRPGQPAITPAPPP
jgi:uncharacterized membrane protein YdjX (TVP38/TMEM64 family)